MDLLSTVLLGLEGSVWIVGELCSRSGRWESAESGSTLHPWMQIALQEAVPSGLSEVQWPPGDTVATGRWHRGAQLSSCSHLPNTATTSSSMRKGDGQRPLPSPVLGTSPSCSLSFLVPGSAVWEFALWLRRLCSV